MFFCFSIVCFASCSILFNISFRLEVSYLIFAKKCSSITGMAISPVTSTAPNVTKSASIMVCRSFIDQYLLLYRDVFPQNLDPLVCPYFGITIQHPSGWEVVSSNTDAPPPPPRFTKQIVELSSSDPDANATLTIKMAVAESYLDTETMQVKNATLEDFVAY